VEFHTAHLIFFSRFPQQALKKTNKTFYTTSPFAYMLYAMNLSARSGKYAAFLLKFSNTISVFVNFNRMNRCHQGRLGWHLGIDRIAFLDSS